MVVVAIISITSGAESSQDDRVCDDESRVKLSILNGLRQEHVMKENRVHQFKKAIDEEKIKVAEAEKSLERMRKVANTTHNQARELLKILDNMTTTELEELEQDQICSEDGFLADCCQVNTLVCGWYHYNVKDAILLFADKETTSFCFFWTLCHQGSMFWRYAIQLCKTSSLL